MTLGLARNANNNRNRTAVGTEMIANSSTSLWLAAATHAHVLFSDKAHWPEQYPSPQSNGDCVSQGILHPHTPSTATQSNPVSGHTPVHGTFNPSHRGAGGVGVVVRGAVVPVVVVVVVVVGKVVVANVVVVVAVIVEVEVEVVAAGVVEDTVEAVELVDVDASVVVVGAAVVLPVVVRVVRVVGVVVDTSGLQMHQQSSTPCVLSDSDKGAGSPG